MSSYLHKQVSVAVLMIMFLLSTCFAMQGHVFSRHITKRNVGLGVSTVVMMGMLCVIMSRGKRFENNCKTLEYRLLNACHGDTESTKVCVDIYKKINAGDKTLYHLLFRGENQNKAYEVLSAYMPCSKLNKVSMSYELVARKILINRNIKQEIHDLRTDLKNPINQVAVFFDKAKMNDYDTTNKYGELFDLGDGFKVQTCVFQEFKQILSCATQ
jgi:hypothetical protein